MDANQLQTLRIIPLGLDLSGAVQALLARQGDSRKVSQAARGSPPGQGPSEDRMSQHQPSRELLDMHAICDGDIQASSPDLTPLQAKLLKLWEEKYEKFMARMDRLQEQNDAKMKGSEASVAPEVDEGHVKCEELIAELFRDFDPEHEAKLLSRESRE